MDQWIVLDDGGGYSFKVVYYADIKKVVGRFERLSDARDFVDHLNNKIDYEGKSMALTAREMTELQGLHDAISHAECFSVNDLRLEGYLLNKASEAQVSKVCSCCYKGGL
jgi:hypothetical protein